MLYYEAYKNTGSKSTKGVSTNKEKLMLLSKYADVW